MSDFNIAFAYMIGNEDYAPDDPRYGKVRTDNDGGLVRFGLNSKSLGKSLVNTDFYTSMPNDEAIKTAMNLYNINIWEPTGLASINSQRVASKVLDMATNTGTPEAAKLTQRAASVNVDGVIGPITISAINAITEDEMLKNLVYWWLWFVDQDIDKHPEYKGTVYEKNWRNRAQKLPAAA